MSSLNPTSSGDLFTIDAVDFYRNVVPTARLDSSHAFCSLWQSFIASLTNGCDNNSFWDPMMRIYTGFSGNLAERERFKAIFLKNPPNVVIADMQSLTLYGRHKRLPQLWSFIYISKYYVDQWVAAVDETAAMTYEAILKATLVHESAHWAQTLRVGLDPDPTQDLPPSKEQKWKKQLTPNCIQTFVVAPNASGEPGYYVELAVFGGILSFQNDTLTIATSKASQNVVSIHALRDLRNLGLCQLISPAASSPSVAPQPPSPSPIHNSMMLCDSEDEEEEFPNRCPREFPALDLMAATWFRD